MIYTFIAAIVVVLFGATQCVHFLPAHRAFGVALVIIGMTIFFASGIVVLNDYLK